MSSEDIDFEVILEITNKSGNFVSYSELYDIIIKKNQEFKNDINFNSKLLLSVITFDSRYNNVIHTVYNNEHYLMWSLTIKNVDDNFFKNNKSSFQYNYIDLIKFYTDNIDDKFDPNIILNSTNNAIHLAIICDNINLLIKLITLYKIDYDIPNKDGKSCITLAKESKNYEILELIITNSYEEKLSKLKEEKIELEKENIELEQENIKLDFDNIKFQNINKVSISLYLLPFILMYFYKYLLNCQK